VVEPSLCSHRPPGFYELFNGPSDQGKVVELRDSLAYKLDYLGLKVHSARVGQGVVIAHGQQTKIMMAAQC